MDGSSKESSLSSSTGNISDENPDAPVLGRLSDSQHPPLGHPLPGGPSRRHKFLFPLVSKKRLKTVGPPMRVPVSRSNPSNFFSKATSGLADGADVINELPEDIEKDDEEERELPQPDACNFTEADGFVSSSDNEKESIRDGGENYDIAEHRKRKADTESQDSAISLTFNMESIECHSQNDAESNIGQRQCESFNVLEINPLQKLYKSSGQNNSFSNCSGLSSNVQCLNAFDNELIQKKQPEDSCLKSSVSKSGLTYQSRRVQFSSSELSRGSKVMECANQCSVARKPRQAQGVLDDLHSQVKYGNLLNLDTDGKSTFSDMFSKENSSRKAYETVATDTDLENLQTHFDSLSLTENQGSQILNNTREPFANQAQNAKLEGFLITVKDDVCVRKGFEDSKINTISGEVAGVTKLPNLLPECSSRAASVYVCANPASSQGESISLALSSITNHVTADGSISSRHKMEMVESERDMKPPCHRPFLENSKRQDVCDSLGISECISSSHSALTSHSMASTQPSLISGGQVVGHSKQPPSCMKEGAGKLLQGELNKAKDAEPHCMPELEEGSSQRSSVSSKENKGQSSILVGGRDKCVQQSSSQVISEKVSNREASTNRKKHYDSDAFFKVNKKIYQKLGKIGSGGSSEVHKVIASDCTIYALKKIKLKGRDYTTAYGFCQEIDYLKRLRGKNHIIQLIDYEITHINIFNDVMLADSKIKDGKITEDAYIYMVLEYGEIDLAQMLMQMWKQLDGASQQIDENWLRYYWQQILKAVNTIHEERIVHSDLKPANFLLVKGVLKLIDFGIAKAIQSDTTNIQRDTQVGTLNYMSPEAFMCNDLDENGNMIKCGRPSDIWSLGCILYQMVYGKTPFADFTTFWAKYKEITNKNHKISYGPVSNPWLLDIMKKCLAWNRNERSRIPELLEHPFLKPPTMPVSFIQQDQQFPSHFQISKFHARDAEAQKLCEHSDPCSKQLALLSSLTQEERYCKSLSEMSKFYHSDDEVQSLCEQLQILIRSRSKKL